MQILIHHNSICGADTLFIAGALNLQMIALMNYSIGKVTMTSPQVNEIPLMLMKLVNLISCSN